MVIQPHKIWNVKLKNGDEFTAEAWQFTIHTIIFKDKGKKFEIKREDIESYKMVKDLTDVPVKQGDRDPGIADKKGPMKAIYQKRHPLP